MRGWNEAEVVATLRGAFPSLLAAYWFGSRARGEGTDDSDWDLAVLVPGYAPPLALWEVGQGLAADLGEDVDLLDLRAATTVLQHQVITTGRRLWAEEPAASLYEAFILSEWTDLQERNQSLVAQIQAEGRVHGR